jgi:hypothetical protein
MYFCVSRNKIQSCRINMKLISSLLYIVAHCCCTSLLAENMSAACCTHACLQFIRTYLHKQALYIRLQATPQALQFKDLRSRHPYTQRCVEHSLKRGPSKAAGESVFSKWSSESFWSQLLIGMHTVSKLFLPFRSA